MRTSTWGFSISMMVLLSFVVTSAQADLLTPSSYDMIGGGTSSLGTTLWDESYPQTSNYQSLSGGLGDLTDGQTTTANWNHPTDYIRYVGWHDSQLANPVIDFYFSVPVTITDIGIHFNAGYVPGSVDFTVGSTTYGFDVDHVNPGGGAATRWVDFALPSSLIGNSIQVTLNDRAWNDVDITGWPTDWVLLTEVKFEGTPGAPVPEPATVLMVGTVLIGLGAARIRKKFKKQ